MSASKREPRGPSLARRLRTEVHAAWVAARDPRCPWYARGLGLIVTAYALSPIDLIPDFVPVLGLLDDALLIPAGLWLFVKLLPPGLMEEARRRAEAAAARPRSAWGLIIVLLLWAATGLLILYLLGFRWG
jgi:uncharacterized membrane protein YkvA (DUF1232 family)